MIALLIIGILFVAAGLVLFLFSAVRMKEDIKKEARKELTALAKDQQLSAAKITGMIQSLTERALLRQGFSFFVLLIGFLLVALYFLL